MRPCSLLQQVLLESETMAICCMCICSCLVNGAVKYAKDIGANQCVPTSKDWIGDSR